MERVLKRSWLKSLGLLIVLMGAAQITLGTSVTLPSDDEMIIGSRAIVRGKVVSVGTRMDENDRIYTYITLKVQEVLKGQITERKIVIKEEGGEYGDRGTLIFGTPQFKLGERVLLYLDTRNDGSLRVHQMFLGKFSIVKDEQTGKEMVVRHAPDQHVLILPPHEHPGQTRGPATNEMELSAYTAMVRSRLEANWEAAVKFEEDFYAGIPVLAKPAEYEEANRRGSIQPNWAFIHSSHPRWFEPDSGQPVLFHINPTGAPSSQTISDVEAAMNAWSVVPGCALRLVNGGTTGNCQPSSSQNTIVFNNCDGRWSGGGCQGVLALGGLSWTQQTTVINGTTFRRATSGFISFNPFAACNFGNNCNVREITTHELGHAIGIGHSEIPDATMWGVAHFDGRCASLRPDDVNAVVFMYPAGAGGGGPLSVLTSSLTGGLVGISYSQVLLATGGTAPYTWSLVSGSGSLPPGLNLSTNGTITGTPTTTGTFNFTVRVTDAASGTATKALSINVASGSTALGSQFVVQTVPTQVNPGQAFTVNLQWLNTGSETWGSGFRVVSQNPPQNSTWGGTNVPLAGLFSVAQGQTLDLSFTVFAPSTPGTYNFQWQMWKDGPGFFGQMSTNVPIQVGSGSGGGGTNNSSFVSQSVPGSMTAGQTYSVIVTMRNNGTTTWTTGSYKLGSQNPQDNTTWGVSRVSLPNPISPGFDVSITFNVTAPTTAGTYNFQWRMLQEGTGFFGASTANLSIQVATAGGSTNNASFIDQAVPETMIAGQVYPFSVTMRNTGTTTWSASSGYALGSSNPTSNTTWGMSRVNLSGNQGPNNEVTFRVNLVAPATPGTYNFQWRMVRDNVFFGTPSDNLSIVVNATDSDSDGDFIPNTVETVEGTNPSVKDNAVFTNNRLFAMQQYRDFLGREGDPEGITFWTGQLNANTLNRAQVIEQFFNSNEFQIGTAPITRLYMAYFLRIPDYEGLQWWLNQYRNGQSLPSISAEFAGSSEFINRYGSLNNADFVTLVYQNVLGRAPDQEGFNYYLGRLNTGSISRGGMMLDFSESAENKNRTYNRVYVTQMYIGLLRRVPEQAGFDQWVGQLDSGTPGVSLINSFMGLAEYRNRFMPPQ
ncbi:MAG TPA: DUF4214 domain-containing protein [Blastocatellia bacterium]|nr:DUF4214 domain-containing protein [Blastocatellia bacterium]